MKDSSKIIQKIDKALEELSSHKGLLVVSKAKAKATLFAISFSQSIVSSNLYLGRSSFFESYSESQFLATSDRFYDEGDGVVITYSSPNSAFLKAHRNDLRYDEFIRRYGKLITRKTYFSKIHPVNKQDLVQEAYAEKDSLGAKKMYGFLNYVFPREAILDYEEKDRELTLVLNPDFSHAYFRTQMRAIGRLESYPTMKGSKVTFFFNELGKLEKMQAFDDFSAKSGILSSAVHMVLVSTFTTSEDDVFPLRGQKRKLRIPDIQEPFEVYGD
ncbi:MAG: hypothetical protein PUA93_07115 [Eubacteriales bacterium]|nr:hypothetical protein [Eubacteriales bacterium]